MIEQFTERERQHIKRWDDDAQNALNRMARASQRGTGCHLTADMIAALSLTAVGSLWGEEDPRS